MAAAVSDTFTITIRIAGQDPFPLTIPRSHEENARLAESHVNKLFGLLSERYRQMGTSKVLAMVAFRFAELLFTQDAHVKEAEQMLDSFEATLDSILLAMPGASEPAAQPRIVVKPLQGPQ